MSTRLTCSLLMEPSSSLSGDMGFNSLVDEYLSGLSTNGSAGMQQEWKGYTDNPNTRLSSDSGAQRNEFGCRGGQYPAFESQPALMFFNRAPDLSCGLPAPGSARAGSELAPSVAMPSVFSEDGCQATHVTSGADGLMSGATCAEARDLSDASTRAMSSIARMARDDEVPEDGAVVHGRGRSKQLTVQEKNRQAQRRFRERQKGKLLEMQRQIEQLNMQVSRLIEEKSSLVSRNNILEKVLELRDANSIGMGDFMGNQDSRAEQSTSESGADDEVLVRLSTSGVHKLEYTKRCIKELTAEEVTAIWNCLVRDMGSLLVVCQNSADGMAEAATDRLQLLATELMTFMMRLVTFNPFAMRRWKDHNGGDSDLQDIADCVEAAELTQQQQLDITQLKIRVGRRLSAIMAERMQITKEIQQMMPNPNKMCHLLTAEAIVTQLRINLKHEQLLMVEFMTVLVSKVLEPVQLARVIITAFPKVPNLVGVVAYVAKQNGDTGELVRSFPGSALYQPWSLARVCEPEGSGTSKQRCEGQQQDRDAEAAVGMQ